MKKKDIILLVVAGIFIIGGLFLSVKNPKPLNSEEQKLAWTTMLEEQKLENKINGISFDYFEAMYNISKEKVVVYIGRSTCGWCQKFSPILEEIAKEEKIKVLYINTDELDQEELSKLQEYSDNKFTGGTPTTLIIQSGEVVDSLNGYVEKEQAITFFKNAGMIG